MIQMIHSDRDRRNFRLAMIQSSADITLILAFLSHLYGRNVVYKTVHLPRCSCVESDAWKCDRKHLVMYNQAPDSKVVSNGCSWSYNDELAMLGKCLVTLRSQSKYWISRSCRHGRFRYFSSNVKIVLCMTFCRVKRHDFMCGEL